MKKLLVCVDGSVYDEAVCKNAAWMAKELKAEIYLLHVILPHSDYKSSLDDYTGSIGLGARTQLLDQLTKHDEDRGRMEQKKGSEVLNQAMHYLKEHNIKKVEILYRRGHLLETIQEIEDSFDIILLGKRQKQGERESDFFGEHLQKITRAIHSPVFCVPKENGEIKRFLIAYDGKESIEKAVAFIIRNTFMRKFECHLLNVQKKSTEISLGKTKKDLEEHGFNVISSIKQGHNIAKEISSYVDENDIDLLVTGTYSHSKLHDLLSECTTTSLIKNCHIPILMFK